MPDLADAYEASADVTILNFEAKSGEKFLVGDLMQMASDQPAMIATLNEAVTAGHLVPTDAAPLQTRRPA